MKRGLVFCSIVSILFASSIVSAKEAMHNSDHDTKLNAEQTDNRHSVVSDRGKAVMPFDLASTTHVFTKTSRGGVQKIVAKQSNDVVQVELARQHMQEIRTKFIKGDFSGPTYIHGKDMPGLAELKAAPTGAIQIEYKNIKGGGQLTYKIKQKSLVTALHAWFDAQVSDHGTDAIAGHNH